MPATLFNLDLAIPFLAAVTFWQVMKVIGIIILVIIVGWILNAVGLLEPILNLLGGLWNLYLIVVVVGTVVLFIYKSVGLGWTILIVLALLLILGVIFRAISVSKQRKQAAEQRQAAFDEAHMRKLAEQALKEGYCLKCGTTNTYKNTYAGTLTCNSCGTVFRLPS